MTRRLSCPGAHNLFAHRFACLALLLIPPLTYAMDVKQLHEIEGIGMMDAQVKTVLDAYGLPMMMIAREPAAERGTTATWHGTQMKLLAGDWEVIYATDQRPADDPVPMWRNPRPTMSPRLGGLARLVLYVKGNVGSMTVRRYPQKTTYDVPKDPFQAHKVIGVRAEYRAPIPVSAIIADYGDKYDTVEGGSPIKLIRYWVLRREGDVPLSLYAVDFELNVKGDAVLASVASSTEVDFVRKKLQIYFDRWEENLYD